jgi:hypothetical protein
MLSAVVYSPDNLQENLSSNVAEMTKGDQRRSQVRVKRMPWRFLDTALSFVLGIARYWSMDFFSIKMPL